MAASVTPAPADDRRLARHRLRRANSSFAWPLRLLPQSRREAMTALYALCRELDDIADDPGPVDRRRAALRAWRDEVRDLYLGHPRHPLARALAPAVDAFGLPREELETLIRGMETDCAPQVRLADSEALDLYCRRVAGSVARLSLHVFGRPDPDAHTFGQSLARALQLTNILRDLDEDAGRGRLYVPRSLLDRHGIAGDSPAEVLADPRFAAVAEELADAAEADFVLARARLAVAGRRGMTAAIAMMALYRRLLARLRRRGWRERRTVPRLGTADKAAVALGLLLRRRA